MEPGRPIRIGPINFHFTALNLLLWGLGLAFLLQVVLAGGLRTGGGGGGPLSLGGLDTFVLWATGSNGPGAVFRAGEPWRLLTAVFIHTSLLHFFMNALSLYQLGRIAEHLYGSARFLLAFVLTGLAGSLASAGWYQYRVGHSVSAGASGAICGLLGLLLAHMRGRKDAAAEWYGRQLLGWAIIIAAFGFAAQFIDNAAHLGGFAAGYLLAQVFETTGFLHLGARRRERLVLALTWVSALAALGCLAIDGLGARERLDYVRAAETLQRRLLEAADSLDRGPMKATELAAVRSEIDSGDAPGELSEIRERALAVLDRDGESPGNQAHGLRNLAEIIGLRAQKRAPDLFGPVEPESG